MAKRNSKLLIGTSGWTYPWENFYGDLPKDQYLSFYSQKFQTVEVNYSFYHLPSVESFKRWREETPEDFVFAMKLSRFITHIKRLVDVEDSLQVFLENASFLEEKLGPVLVQFPPSFRIELEKLENFLKNARKIGRGLQVRKLRLAFEFRHKSWFDEENQAAIFKILHKYKVAFVFAHSWNYPYPENEPITTDFIYLRLHGPKALLASKYDERVLAQFADKIKRWRSNGLDVYVYFNNDVKGYALGNADTLMKLCGMSDERW